MNEEPKYETQQEKIDRLLKEQMTNNTLSQEDQKKVDNTAKQNNIDELIRRMTEETPVEEETNTKSI